jgi:hypothetical protein
VPGRIHVQPLWTVALLPSAGDRYPDEFGPADRPGNGTGLWCKSVQGELQDTGEVPVPGIRVRSFAS